MITNNITHQKITTNSTFHGLPIMCAVKNPCYVEIINKTYRELTLLSARYNRIIVVRLDFKLSDFAYASKVNISQFRRSFVRKMEKKYNSKIGFQWVREFGKSDKTNPTHWHWWVAMKACKKNKPAIHAQRIHTAALEAWVTHTDSIHSKVNNAGYFSINRKDLSVEGRKLQQLIIANGPSENQSDVLTDRKVIANRALSNVVVGGVFDECFYALSYMAKLYTKTSTKNTKGKPIFANSNLNTNDKKSGRKEVIERNLSKIHEWLKVPLDTMPLTYKTKVRIKKKKDESELLTDL